MFKGGWKLLFQQGIQMKRLMLTEQLMFKNAGRENG